MADPSTAVATQAQQPRTRMVVADVVPIFDTGRFEQYGRIAAMMAQTRMMPLSLTQEKIKNERGQDVVVDLDYQTIVARGFRITALADRWNCDPFALMGACSFVHNQLMVEGKVIHGVIDAELGVVLDYQWGKWNALTEECAVGEPAEGDYMGVRVIGDIPGVGPRWVDGGVGSWKTTGNNTPWKPGAYKRMLRYRGAREWARAHKPSLLIGIIGDDEMEDYRERREVSAPHLDPGFPQERLQSPQEPAKAETAKRTPGRRKAADGPQQAQEEGKSSGGDNAEYIDPDTGEVYASIEERLAAEKAKREAGGGEVIEGESRVVQGAEQGSDTKGSATDASQGSQDRTDSGQQQQDERSSGGAEGEQGQGEQTGGSPTTDASTTTSPTESQPETASTELGQAHPFLEAIVKIGEAPHWDAVKQAIRGAAKLETWTKDEQARHVVRGKAWDRYTELRDTGVTVPLVASDLVVMGLWLDFGADSEAAIDGMWRTFFRSAAYTTASEDDKARITERMTARKAQLKG